MVDGSSCSPCCQVPDMLHYVLWNEDMLENKWKCSKIGLDALYSKQTHTCASTHSLTPSRSCSQKARSPNGEAMLRHDVQSLYKAPLISILSSIKYTITNAVPGILCLSPPLHATRCPQSVVCLGSSTNVIRVIYMGHVSSG